MSFFLTFCCLAFSVIHFSCFLTSLLIFVPPTHFSLPASLLAYCLSSPIVFFISLCSSFLAFNLLTYLYGQLSNCSPTISFLFASVCLLSCLSLTVLPFTCLLSSLSCIPTSRFLLPTFCCPSFFLAFNFLTYLCLLLSHLRPCLPPRLSQLAYPIALSNEASRSSLYHAPMARGAPRGARGAGGRAATRGAASLVIVICYLRQPFPPP